MKHLTLSYHIVVPMVIKAKGDTAAVIMGPTSHDTIFSNSTLKSKRPDDHASD